MHIRQLKPGDSHALCDFYNGLCEASKRTFRPVGEKTTPDVCRGIIADNDDHRLEKYDLVAIEGKRIIGWSFIWNLNAKEPTFGLGVADDFQGKGIGSRLMDRVLADIRQRALNEVYLTVVQENLIAKTMYERRGFVVYGDYHGEDNLDYFRMKLVLNQSFPVKQSDSEPKNG